jgi:hypothetical protein
MIHLLLDAARMKTNMALAKELNPNHSSLYKGRSEEALADFAPYMFSFSAENQFDSWFLEKGWGNSWGVLLASSAADAEVYRHFRKFLLVPTDEGKQVYFRFYDPRVLRVFLKTCDARQLQVFFGPIDYFLIENLDSAYGTYHWLANGELKTKQLDQAAIRQAFSIA